MSTEDKKTIEMVTTWVMRALSAVGAVFFMSLYDTIREQDQKMHDMTLTVSQLTWRLANAEKESQELRECCRSRFANAADTVRRSR
jgi:hypothetical protein